MTDRYVGPGGNDGNSGLTWALRKLTLNGAEDTPVVAGDDIYVGPGVYREDLICDVSGGNVYAAGTVTVTNGSTTVTGAGTAFVANVAVADMFHIRLLASGNDGVTNGTATFTSAAGNFQASMIGKTIQIRWRGAYGIVAVAAANQITLTDPNGLGWPAAGVNRIYSVMSGEGPYEIDSVTDDTNFELVRPWCGPTLTGIVYITYRPIRYIADVSGERTDGVGGICRITGSDNDQTVARNYCVTVGVRAYRLFRGFRMDLADRGVYFSGAGAGLHLTIEDCTFLDFDTRAISQWGDATSHCLTVRRCVNLSGRFAYLASAAVDCLDSGDMVENCLGNSPTRDWVSVYRKNGVTIKNCTVTGAEIGVYWSGNQTWGTVVVNNCIFTSCTQAVRTEILGEITEDYNTFFLNWADRVNVGVGPGSQAWPSLLLMPMLLAGDGQDSGFKFPWWLGELSEWSPTRALAGNFEACHDLRTIGRPVTSAKKSWGALQFTDMERDTSTPYAGTSCMGILDAGRIQFKVPIAAESTTVEVWVHREANYAGTNPQLVIKQPGQADRTTTDAGAAGAYNLLTDTFTPAALPPYIFIELVSNNTAVAGNYATYFDNLRVG